MTSDETHRMRQPFHSSGLAVFALLILLAAAIRVAGFFVHPPERLIGDEIYYVQVAANIAAGRGHVWRDPEGVTLRAWRPPGHSALLSLWVDSSRVRSTRRGLRWGDLT